MKNKECQSTGHKSKIGGQALIEGVMMRGIDKAAMSVRLPDGSIDTESWKSEASIGHGIIRCRLCAG